MFSNRHALFEHFRATLSNFSDLQEYMDSVYNALDTISPPPTECFAIQMDGRAVRNVLSSETECKELETFLVHLIADRHLYVPHFPVTSDSRGASIVWLSWKTCGYFVLMVSAYRKWYELAGSGEKVPSCFLPDRAQWIRAGRAVMEYVHGMCWADWERATFPDECSICLEVMLVKTFTPCRHAFHAHCLEQLLARNTRSCSLCRAPIV